MFSQSFQLLARDAEEGKVEDFKLQISINFPSRAGNVWSFDFGCCIKANYEVSLNQSFPLEFVEMQILRGNFLLQ